MKRCCMVCFAVGIQLLLPLIPIEKVVAESDTTGRSIDSPREALEAAYSYTGYKDINDLLEAEDYSCVRVITLEDSTIPFLVDQVYGKPVWRISLDTFYLDMPKYPDEKEAEWNPKQFSVLIDSTAGFFVKACIEYEGGDQAVGPDPPAHIAERGYEFFEFSREFPKVNLYEALGAAAGANPLAAKKVSVYLVIGEYWRGNRLMWFVFSRGFPPMKILHGTSTSCESAVDATTGQWLYSGY